MYVFFFYPPPFNYSWLPDFLHQDPVPVVPFWRKDKNLLLFFFFVWLFIYSLQVSKHVIPSASLSVGLFLFPIAFVSQLLATWGFGRWLLSLWKDKKKDKTMLPVISLYFPGHHIDGGWFVSGLTEAHASHFKAWMGLFKASHQR